MTLDEEVALNRKLYEGGVRSQRAYECRERLYNTIAQIHEMMGRPGSQLLTSNQLHRRADSRRHIASMIKLMGGRVRPEYDSVDYREVDDEDF